MSIYSYSREPKKGKAKENTETETSLQNDLKIGDLVLVRDINSGVFEPKYSKTTEL